ncbi:MAG: TIGR03915 family putative DNA repair protein [Bacteroidota bacterium]
MILTYDGTYEGLLSAVFETYRLKIVPERIVPAADWQPTFFDQAVFVATRDDWAERVEQGIQKISGRKAVMLLRHCFLSERADVSMLTFRFIRQTISRASDISDNYANADVLRLHQLKKQIGREVHRMHAFVRFQRTRDNIYYAVIEPDFNVIPLIGAHFEDRYPAQDWLIYDVKRHYGIFYDQQKIDFVTFDNNNTLPLRQLQRDALDTTEPEYQQLWKTYFDNVNIPERRNLKLHHQHVPKRYWKYLSEKRAQF